jgi:hypothetical protein
MAWPPLVSLPPLLQTLVQVRGQAMIPIFALQNHDLEIGEQESDA